MSDARDDIRNLFQSQGLSGGYREFGERPAQPRAPSVDKPSAAQPEAPAPHATQERRAPHLDLVRDAERAPTAPTPPTAPKPPLASLFQRLAEAGNRGGSEGANRKTPEQLMQLPLDDLFEHLNSQGERR